MPEEDEDSRQESSDDTVVSGKGETVLPACSTEIKAYSSDSKQLLMARVPSRESTRASASAQFGVSGESNFKESSHMIRFRFQED